ncbi:MAG TPA: hypothetical protein VGK58_12645 [Lacipirellulaceae bacterium]
MTLYIPSERETTIRDAFSSEGKTPEQRTAMFLDLMATIDAIQAHLTPEERERRQQIADKIDPRPDPWWRNCRKEALAEYECQTSSM